MWGQCQRVLPRIDGEGGPGKAADPARVGLRISHGVWGASICTPRTRGRSLLLSGGIHPYHWGPMEITVANVTSLRPYWESLVAWRSDVVILCVRNLVSLTYTHMDIAVMFHNGQDMKMAEISFLQCCNCCARVAYTHDCGVHHRGVPSKRIAFISSLGRAERLAMYSHAEGKQNFGRSVHVPVSTPSCNF